MSNNAKLDDTDITSKGRNSIIKRRAPISTTNENLKHQTDIKECTNVNSNISCQKNLQSKKNVEKKLKKKLSKKLMICCCIGSILILYPVVNYFDISPIKISFYFREKKHTDVLNDVKIGLHNITAEYKNQEKILWQNVYASVNMIVKNPTKPSIIVLLADKYNPLDCLVGSLANVISNAYNTDSLLLTPKDFDNSTGSVITSMPSKVENNKIVIIWDLLNINVEAFKAFHNLLDTHNPLIKEVIYIIAIIADNYDNKSNPLKFIENEIEKKLKGKVKYDTIQPLITRITDGAVLKVKSESSIIDCSLSTIKKKQYNFFNDVIFLIYDFLIFCNIF